MRLKNRAPPLALLVVALVLALGSLGVAYSLWSGTLYINGTVNTGHMDPDWLLTNINSFDPEGAIDPNKDKDVGATICPDIGSADDILVVTVQNAYPSYESGCALKWWNNGSIPMKLCGMSCPTAPSWLDVHIQNTLYEVVDVGGSASGQLEFHVEQEAPQGATATFECQFLQVQWNEPCP